MFLAQTHKPSSLLPSLLIPAPLILPYNNAPRCAARVHKRTPARRAHFYRPPGLRVQLQCLRPHRPCMRSRTGDTNRLLNYRRTRFVCTGMQSAQTGIAPRRPACTRSCTRTRCAQAHVARAETSCLHVHPHRQLSRWTSPHWRSPEEEKEKEKVRAWVHAPGKGKDVLFTPQCIMHARSKSSDRRWRRHWVST
jgi:hypothetical protein